MKDMAKTASRLDGYLKFLSILIIIAAIFQIISLGIVAAAFLFDLDPAFVGTNWEMANLGFMTIYVSSAYVPNYFSLLWQAAVEASLSLLSFIIGYYILKSLRNTLLPMKTGNPFHNTTSSTLRKLAVYTCILGIGLNAREVISNILLVKAYDLPNLIIGEKITHVTFNNSFDLSFLLVAAGLLLLSYVFRYGEQLQQLSDETL